MKPATKAALPVFVLGLALGAVAGSVAQRSLMRRFMKNGPDAQRMVKHLTRDLSLDEAQRASVLAALEARKPAMEALRTEGDAKFEALRAETNADIRKLLTPDQIVKFDALVAKWEARHKDHHGGPGPR